MERTPLKRRTRLKPVNRKRAALRKKRDFGKYAEWIRGHECAVGLGHAHFYGFGSQLIQSQAAHARSRGVGGRAAHLLPLCLGHHIEQHQHGTRTFEKKYGISLAAVATALAARWKEETGQA